MENKICPICGGRNFVKGIITGYGTSVCPLKENGLPKITKSKR